MNLCNKNHDEVCFEGYTCPACFHMEKLEKRIEELEREASDLNDEIGELENEIGELKDQIP
jgi:predicted RNase H-like nuclease (RuvC/YqgF family)